MTEEDAAEEYKIWLAIRADLDMPPGKLAAQAGHAFMGIGLVAPAQFSYWNAYLESAMPKITVSVPDERGLLKVHEFAEGRGIPHYLVRDAGRTCFSEPTYTVCAFGPCLRSELPPYLKRLRLYE